LYDKVLGNKKNYMKKVVGNKKNHMKRRFQVTERITVKKVLGNKKD
jgi:hypothetical protein